MADTTATHTSPVPWTRRTSDGCSTTAGTSSRECTCGSTNSCDGSARRPCVFPPPFYILEELFLFFLLLLLHPSATPDRPSCQGLWSTTEVCQIFLVSSSFFFFFSFTPPHPFHCQERKVGEQSEPLIWSYSSFNSSFLKALNFVIPLSLGLPPLMPFCILLSYAFSLDSGWWVQGPSVEAVSACVRACEGRLPSESHHHALWPPPHPFFWVLSPLLLCFSPCVKVGDDASEGPERQERKRADEEIKMHFASGSLEVSFVVLVGFRLFFLSSRGSIHTM